MVFPLPLILRFGIAKPSLMHSSLLISILYRWSRFPYFSVLSNSLWPHGLQHAMPPCPSPTPGVCSNSCPSSRWCHPTNLILCRPLLLLPSVFPSIRVFSNESVLRIRWPKYWSFSFSISLSNEYSGLISFRMDCFDLLAVEGTLKSLLQHHSSEASILQHSAFFIMIKLGLFQGCRILQYMQINQCDTPY